MKWLFDTFMFVVKSWREPTSWWSQDSKSWGGLRSPCMIVAHNSWWLSGGYDQFGAVILNICFTQSYYDGYVEAFQFWWLIFIFILQTIR